MLRYEYAWPLFFNKYYSFPEAAAAPDGALTVACTMALHVKCNKIIKIRPKHMICEKQYTEITTQWHKKTWPLTFNLHYSSIDASAAPDSALLLAKHAARPHLGPCTPENAITLLRPKYICVRNNAVIKLLKYDQNTYMWETMYWNNDTPVLWHKKTWPLTFNMHFSSLNRR